MNYRQKFEQYYGIKIPKGYVIHHIDFNRGNNDIRNLMVLPKSLHQKYHFFVNCLDKNPSKPYERLVDVRITGDYMPLCFGQFETIVKIKEIVMECSKWFDYKNYLDGIMPNVHNLSLEEI